MMVTSPHVLVTNRLLIVRHQIQASNVKDLIELRRGLLVVWTGDLSLELRTRRLIGEIVSRGAQRASSGGMSRRTQARGAGTEDRSHLDDA